MFKVSVSEYLSHIAAPSGGSNKEPEDTIEDACFIAPGTNLTPAKLPIARG
jgi:hypothetical protein